MKMSISAEIRSEGAPIRHAVVTIADNLTGVIWASKDFIDLPTRSFYLQSTVYLPQGANRITIRTESASGTISSSSRTVFVGGESMVNMVSNDRKDRAPLFATDAYETWPDLVNPVADGFRCNDQVSLLGRRKPERASM